MAKIVETQEGRRRVWVLGGLLVLMTVVAYGPAIFRGGFVWDDDSYVTENVRVERGDGLETIWLRPSKLPQYYPVVFTTFWVEYRLWGLEPAGYHAVNVLLHAGSAVLVWRILLRLRVRGAWLAGALFAVHPVMVESVAWVTERKNVLSGVFYLAAMLVYLRFSLAERRAWRLYAGALGLFMLALLSKSVTCSFPVAVLIVLWYRRGVSWRDVGLMGPFFLLGALAAINTAMLERVHVGAMGGDWALSPVERVLIAGRALWFYPWKLVAPVGLTFFYPRWVIDAGVWWQWVFPVMACGVGAAVVVGSWRRARRMPRGVAAGILFFGVTIFPALGFTNIYPMKFTFVADHYQYLASLGVLVLVAAGMARVGERMALRSRVIVGGGLLLVLVGMTAAQCVVYHDERSLWTDTIQKNPTAYAAYDNLGMLELKEGRFEEALALLEKGRALKPANHVEVYQALGTLYLKQGRVAEAVPMLEEMLRQEGDPYFKALAANMLGTIAADRGDMADAEGWFEKSTRYFPEFEGAWLNLQQVEAALGNREKAEAAGEEARRLERENGR